MKYFILLIFFISTNLFAVESTDILNVNVIKAYDNNILVINRGLEDGIYKADHIKLTNKEGYIARAICIKASMLISHWKVYRVVRPELLSYDSEYKLTSMNQSEIPKDMQKFQKRSFKDKYTDFTDKDAKKSLEMQQERIANFDLPKDMEYDPLLKESRKSESEKFIEKNFDFKKMTDDLSSYHISIYSSPYSTESRTRQKQANYGIQVVNKGKKYQLAVEYARKENTKANQYTDEFISSEETNKSAQFLLREFSPDIDYVLSYQNRQAKIGDIINPKDHTMFAPLGFRFNLSNPKNEEKIYFTYLLIMDSYKFEYNDNGVPTEESMDNIRHGLNLTYENQISEKAKFLLNAWYRPYMDLGKQEIDFENNLSDISATISWGLMRNLFAEYTFNYQNDINLSRYYDIKSVNQINTFNIRYNFDI